MKNENAGPRTGTVVWADASILCACVCVHPLSTKRVLHSVDSEKKAGEGIEINPDQTNAGFSGKPDVVGQYL